MPVLEGKELRIVGFLCNWCSYGGADAAGVGRAVQPTDLRIIRVPCSGRVDPIFIVKALLNGADGVLVSGCHPRDCHYSAGNFYARRRLEVLKQFLPVLGIDEARFEYTWVGASEAQLWQHVVTTFTNRVHALGKAPRFDAVEPLLKIADMALTALRPLGTGKNAALPKLKEAIKAKLPELECVIGWQQGYDEARTVPLFARTPQDVDKFVWGPFNVNNPAVYLPTFRGKKVGIVVKGCDARSVVELLQENLISREDVILFAMPCEGTLDMARIGEKLGRYTTVDAVVCDEASITITADGKEHRFCMADFAQGKCYGCATPLAALSDVSFGAPVDVKPVSATPPELALLDSLSLPERMSFWRGQMGKCLRCYACRNACPMCVCRDYCVSDSRDPHWMSQLADEREKLFFQTVHAFHLAGRCTGCGECQRACPVGIPILALRQQIGRVIEQLFESYKAGTDPAAAPPLLTYMPQEKNIHERGWK
ncbi:MAG: NAD(P)H dehydrogenase subunit CD [Candidatus Desulfovibrio kirbyi]|jgi:coenzyme F420-reducing hydrogenase delta subunit/ferredoxin|uniref:NAD(P)H dehydrogenase subunit CD n=1 Tax=Candidatus Desulfovibrio kirbyi TaxID=2696086 RepID=A0A6L2R6Y1_9BACT|nr:hydrogenase iron-sulfur subunit [Desulfovibrio sp.]GFH63212.1 MAG: NAD(P)H dehydrogenase subunit CD [Candidatus Desulfovibrio kirbyi]